MTKTVLKQKINIFKDNLSPSGQYYGPPGMHMILVL
jgi:hypothetical protein